METQVSWQYTSNWVMIMWEKGSMLPIYGLELISYPDLTVFYIGRGRSGYEISLEWHTCFSFFEVLSRFQGREFGATNFKHEHYLLSLWYSTTFSPS